VLNAKDEWPFAEPLATGIFSQCTSKVYDAEGYVATLVTDVSV